MSSLISDEYNRDGLIFTPIDKGICDENDEPIRRRMGCSFFNLIKLCLEEEF